MKLISLISESFIETFFDKKVYKCIATIKKDNDDEIIDAFEIEEYTYKRAYKSVYEILKYKYPGIGISLIITQNE